MEQNIFSHKSSKFISHLDQLKNTVNILVVLLGLNRGNLMECQVKKKY